jgi:transcriptional regulator with XRE-family HTH domain
MQDQRDFYRQVGQNIHEARGKTLSQDALALAVGLTRSSISNIEKGRQKLLLHTLVDIASALKVDASLLLPSRKTEIEVSNARQLEALPANERNFIESAIGVVPQTRKTEKVSHGGQEKKNPGNSRATPGRGSRDKRAGTGMGTRPRARRSDRG